MWVWPKKLNKFLPDREVFMQYSDETNIGGKVHGIHNHLSSITYKFMILSIIRMHAGADLDLTARRGIAALEAHGEIFWGSGFITRHLAHVRI